VSCLCFICILMFSLMFSKTKRRQYITLTSQRLVSYRGPFIRKGNSVVTFWKKILLLFAKILLLLERYRYFWTKHYYFSKKKFLIFGKILIFLEKNVVKKFQVWYQVEVGLHADVIKDLRR
jgi:hypothetical protein